MPSSQRLEWRRGRVGTGEHGDPPINPGWERRLLPFLESSGVGRVLGVVDEEEAHAFRFDGWINFEELLYSICSTNFSTPPVVSDGPRRHIGGQVVHAKVPLQRITTKGRPPIHHDRECDSLISNFYSICSTNFSDPSGFLWSLK